MKDQEVERISANEINRYLYCPYQWYYKRTYGTKALQEQYRTLGVTSSNHMNHYTKGTQYHSHYHRRYRIKRFCQWVLLVVLVALVIKVALAW